VIGRNIKAGCYPMEGDHMVEATSDYGIFGVHVILKREMMKMIRAGDDGSRVDVRMDVRCSFDQAIRNEMLKLVFVTT
jgi:hypothetical protein